MSYPELSKQVFALLVSLLLGRLAPVALVKGRSVFVARLARRASRATKTLLKTGEPRSGEASGQG